MTRQGMGRGNPFGYVRVEVSEVPGAGGGRYARCLDNNGNEYRVHMGLRVGGGRFPQVGDNWLLTKVGQVWAFHAYIGRSHPIVIRAPRDGADRLTIELLDALVELGLVVEEDRDRESNPD